VPEPGREINHIRNAGAVDSERHAPRGSCRNIFSTRKQYRTETTTSASARVRRIKCAGKRAGKRDSDTRTRFGHVGTALFTHIKKLTLSTDSESGIENLFENRAVTPPAVDSFGRNQSCT
jgi:hypothetical protein